jgi:hypothetical protein
MLPSGLLALTRRPPGAISQPVQVPAVVPDSLANDTTLSPPPLDSLAIVTILPPPPDSLANDTTFSPPPLDSVAIDTTFSPPDLKQKVYDEDPQVVQHYKDSISAACRVYGADRVWNMDEIAWKDIQRSGKTVARRGAVSVPVAIHGDPKAQISAVCTISMSGRKLAPIYILRGGTERAFAAFSEAIGENRATCSENSWMDTAVMLKYLSWLHAASHEDHCALVMDSFGADFPEEVLDKAVYLGIELIPVPKGLAGKWQPLDRRCFGPLKRLSQRLWGEKAARQPGLQWNHIEAARLLEEAWDELTMDTVLAAWDFSSGNDTEIEDSGSDESP